MEKKHAQQNTSTDRKKNKICRSLHQISKLLYLSSSLSQNTNKQMNKQKHTSIHINIKCIQLGEGDSLFPPFFCKTTLSLSIWDTRLCIVLCLVIKSIYFNLLCSLSQSSLSQEIQT